MTRPSARSVDTELPSRLRASLDASLAAARLPRRDREDIEAELTAHFADGLARGRDPEELLRDFGEPAAAGQLIGRGARRRRRAGRPILRAAWLLTAAVVLVYAGTLARLHLPTPETVSDATPGARLGVLSPWLADSPSLAEAVVRARAQVASGDFAAALEAVRELGRGPFPAHDLAGLRLAAEIRRVAPATVRPELIDWSSDKVRSAFDALLAAMYSAGEDGTLTAAGLRVYQAWKGKLEPGAWAAMLEPAYFPNPARRGEVRRELGRFVRLAAERNSGAFERERDVFVASSRRTLRFAALEIPLAHLAEVRRAERELRAPDQEKRRVP